MPHDKGLFHWVPDLNSDGEHDITDYLILDELNNATHREDDARGDRTSSLDIDEDDEDDEDILLKYGIDRNDYYTREDFLEAVQEAKTEQAENYKEGLKLKDSAPPREYGEEPEDAWLHTLLPELFSTDEDEDEDEDDDNEDAERRLGALEGTVSVNIPLSLSVEVSYPGRDELDKIKESDYPNVRTYEAAYSLCDILYGDPFIHPDTTKEAEEARCRFILSQSCIAARYLTRYDGFLYVQAVKEHFRLPIDVPDEDDKVKTHFQDFLMELAEEDVNLALDVWAWCIREFGAYRMYMERAYTLYSDILCFLDDYPDEFRESLIDRLGSDRNLRRELFTDCPGTPACVSELVIHALTTDRARTAEEIFIAAIANPNSDSRWKEELLENMISECSNWEELESMEAVQAHILPIAEKIEDKRIQRVLPRMAQKMQDYIRSVESWGEKYQFSRRFAWRATCADGSPYGIHPTDYETEQEYLAAIEESKYEWREYVDSSLLRYADPRHYETADEFHAAVREASAREATEREAEARATHRHDPNDKTVYSFCQVVPDGASEHAFFYFPGALSLHPGDRVMVPFGRDNTEVYGTVVAAGECYGRALPCPVDRIKYVKNKA